MSPDGLYRVAVNNYIAAGGSGFVVLQRNTSQQDTGVSLRNSLTVFLTQQPGVCDGMNISQILDDTDTETSKSCKRNSDCASGSCVGATMSTDGKCAQGTIQQLWGNISCLDENIEKHDGRIRPVFQ